MSTPSAPVPTTPAKPPTPPSTPAPPPKAPSPAQKSPTTSLQAVPLPGTLKVAVQGPSSAPAAYDPNVPLDWNQFVHTEMNDVYEGYLKRQKAQIVRDLKKSNKDALKTLSPEQLDKLVTSNLDHKSA